MIKIQKDEYIFEVDLEKTAEYYRAHPLCVCDYCQNFYAQAGGMFPKLESFLSDFGVDISKPDEMMGFELGNTIQYISVDYTVCGKVIHMGQHEIDIPDNQFFSLVITDGFCSPNSQTEEYFTISVKNISELPWVLDKPFPKPANLKKTSKVREFFRKVFRPT